MSTRNEGSHVQTKNTPEIKGPDDYVLVATFSDTCGHCKVFKDTQLEKLRNLAKKINRIKLVEIDLPKMESGIPKDHGNNMNNRVPFFALYPFPSWNKAIQANKTSSPPVRLNDGRFYNNKIGPNGYPQAAEKPSPYTAENIITWAISFIGNERPKIEISKVSTGHPNRLIENCKVLKYVNSGNSHC